MVKKYFLIFFIIIVLLILVACNQQISEEKTTFEEEYILEGCIDTEGNVMGFYNQDFRTKGEVSSKYMWEIVSASSELVPFGQKTDSCEGGQLIEYGCAVDEYTGKIYRGGTAETHYISCFETVGEGYTCKDGACVREEGEETTVIADCGGPYSVTLADAFTFDGTKSQGDIVYYEVSFSDMSEIDKIRANVSGSSEILIEYTYEEAAADFDSVTLIVQDSTGTKDYCQLFFKVYE